MIKIPNYKIIKKIGSGGMGDVYLAEHNIIKRKVAIKSLHPHLLTNKEFITRFRREARLLSTLDHSKIVRLNDYLEHDGGLYLIMEYVEGIQLNDYITSVQGVLSEKQLLGLFKQVVSAISYSHKKGLIHRDIKPSNILVSNGKIKVLDFGIAKLLEEDQGLTQTGVRVGTVSSMSPEQVNGEKVDLLSDIYSLGVTLFYMSVGDSPYAKTNNAVKIGMRIISEPFPDARSINPDISDKMLSIINKATQKEKKDRYQSCEDFIKALKDDGVSTVINNSNEKTIVEQKKVKKGNEEKTTITTKKTTKNNTLFSKYDENLKREATKKEKMIALIFIFIVGIGIFLFFKSLSPNKEETVQGNMDISVENIEELQTIDTTYENETKDSLSNSPSTTEINQSESKVNK